MKTIPVPENLAGSIANLLAQMPAGQSGRAFIALVDLINSTPEPVAESGSNGEGDVGKASEKGD